MSLRQKLCAVRARGRFMNGSRGGLLLLLSLHPAHMIAHSSKGNIKHEPQVGKVRGQVISDITFLLRTYFLLRNTAINASLYS